MVSLEVQHVPQPVLGVVVAVWSFRSRMLWTRLRLCTVLAKTGLAVGGAQFADTVAVDHENNCADADVVAQPQKLDGGANSQCLEET